MNNDFSQDTLYVILPHFNLFKFKNCTENLYIFLKNSYLYNNIKIVLVEGYYTDEDKLPDLSEKVFKHIRIKLKDILWSKENLINIAFKSLPSDWKYGAWIDRDTFFTNHNWAQETIEKLKTCDIMQPWGECIFLEKDYSIDSGIYDKHVENFYKSINERISCNSFCKTAVLFNINLQNKEKKLPRYNDRNLIKTEIPSYIKKLTKVPFTALGHVGHAWAINRKFYEKIGKIYDFGITGESDNVIAKSIVNDFDDGIMNFYKRELPNYMQTIINYSKNFENVKVGYLNNLILHYYHGKIKNRFYLERQDILLNAKFDPEKHLKYNENGILEYTEEGKSIETSMKKYFFFRKEDA